MPFQTRKSGADVGEAGYSIVELLVVLAIIAMIAGLAVPQVLRYLGSARTQTAQTQIKNIEGALELYYLDNGSYPTTAEGLSALSVAPIGATRWNGPYLKNVNVLKDPWSRDYIYKVEATTALIVSLGRDGEEGGEGEDQDVTSN